MLRCYSFNELKPAKVVILLWLASSFFKFLRVSNSNKFYKLLYEIIRTSKFTNEEIKAIDFNFKFEKFANWSTDGSCMLSLLISNSSAPWKSKF